MIFRFPRKPKISDCAHAYRTGRGRQGLGNDYTDMRKVIHVQESCTKDF
jgi:hypothetical protein